MKSVRSKSFSDLRFALEAVLKAFIALGQPPEMRGKPLIAAVTAGGHDLKKLLSKAKALNPDICQLAICGFVDRCHEIEVGVRYSLDAFEFLNDDEELYYNTIGDHRWMMSLYDAIKAALSNVNAQLQTFSRIVSVADIFEELFEPDYNSRRERREKRGKADKAPAS